MSVASFILGFGARDEGMDSAFDRGESGLARVNAALEAGRRLGDRMAASLSSAVGTLTALNVNSLTQAIEGASQSNGGLTNSIEAFGVQADAAMRPVLARAGLLGDEFASARSGISGFAYATNRDAATVAQAFAAVEQAADPVRAVLDDMGLGYRELATLQDVTGISADALTSHIGGLAQSWNLSSSQIETLLDDVTALSHEAGVGSAVWEQYGSILQAVDQGLSLSGLDASAENIAAIQTDLVRLSGVFRDGVGASPDEALASSLAVFQSMTSESASYRNMVAGLGSEFGPLVTRMAEFQDLNSSIDMMETNPMEFVESLHLMREALVDQRDAFDENTDGYRRGALQLQRFDEQVSGVNMDLLYLTRTGDRATDAINKMKSAAPEAEGAFKEMAKEGYSAGITLEESLDRARLGFETTLRGISRGSVRSFVRDQRRMYRQLGDEVEALGGDDRWGPLVKRLSAMHQLGVVGLFVDLENGVEGTSDGMRRAAAVSGLLFDSMQSLAPMLLPAVVAFQALGGPRIIGGLMGLARGAALFGAGLVSWPIALAAAVAGLFVFRDEVGAGLEHLTGFVDRATDWLGSLDGAELAASVTDWLSGIPDAIASVFSGGIGGVGSALALGSSLGSSLGQMFVAAGDFVMPFLSTMGGRISAGLAEVLPNMLSGSEIGGRVRSAIGGALTSINWSGIASVLGEGVIDVQVWIDNMLDKVRALDAGAMIASASDWIAGFFTGLFEGGAEVGANGFVEWLSDEGMTILGGMISLAGELAWTIAELLGEAIAGVSYASMRLSAAFRTVLWEVFKGGFELLVDLTSYAIEWFDTQLIQPALGFLAENSDAFGEMYYGFIVQPLIDAFTWFNSLPERLSALFTEKVVEPAVSALSPFLEFGRRFFIEPVEAGLAFFPTLPDRLGVLIEENIILPFEEMSDRLREAGAAIVGNIVAGLEQKWQELKDSMTGGLQDIRDLLTGSEPRDRQSPLFDLGHSGQAFLMNILAGMQDTREVFREGVAEVLGDSAAFAINRFVTMARQGASARIMEVSSSLSNLLSQELSRAQVAAMNVSPSVNTDVAQEIVVRADIRDLIVAVYDVAAQQNAILTEISTNTRETADNTTYNGRSVARLVLQTAG